VGEFVIIHRIKEKDVPILRVAHGSRKIEMRFGH
jgi:hypothetical protein